MILSIVVALIIFFWGIPIAIWLFILTIKAVSAAFDLAVNTFFGACFGVLDAIAYALGWTIRCIHRGYCFVRAQVQNLG
jgi:hypothetical protein